MNENIIVSALIVVAWALVVFMAIASLALGATALGREYVFTAPGVSRMGPRVNQRIASVRFMHQGIQTPLQHLLSSLHPTLLVFSGGIGQETRVRDAFISGILEFASFFDGGLKVCVFCTSGCDWLESIAGNGNEFEIIPLEDDFLITALAIRVAPYALLVDRRARVLGKGLVNNLAHLCLLVERGGKQRSGDGELDRVNCMCSAHLRTQSLQESVARHH